MAISSIQDVVEKGLCISCGACAAAVPQGAIEMVYEPNRGMYYPKIINSDLATGKGKEFEVCPGKGYPIQDLSKIYLTYDAKSDPYLGNMHGTWVGRSNNNTILKNASSGGIMTAIADYLIQKELVVGAVVTGLVYGSDGPRPNVYIALTSRELLDSQGSKYCPSPTLIGVTKALEIKGPFVFLGTPCQIAGLRMMQKINPELKKKFPYVIGNFCGGFRDLRETDTLIRRQGWLPSEVTNFRYRGGGQPGSMRMRDKDGNTVSLPYPQYSRQTGVIKNRRCRMCVDATAELADISCGDAWLPRYQDSKVPWSVIITRSDETTQLLQSMHADKRIEMHTISTNDIKISQRGNLRTKKDRQSSRRRLFKMLGYELPVYDGGFPSEHSGLLFEARVFLTQIGFYALEKMGIYPSIAKLLKRY